MKAKIEDRFRKKYQVMSFIDPGFTCGGVGFSEWSESFRRTLSTFSAEDRFCWVLNVKTLFSYGNGKIGSECNTGVFRTLADVIAAIEEEEGGAK